MARYTPRTTQELRQLVRDPQISLGDIDVSNITDFSFLFTNDPFQPQLKFDAHDRYDYAGIETWNVAHAVTMQGMFAGCRYFNANLNKWDVHNVTNMVSMFEGCTLFDQTLTWSTASLTNTTRMFKDCYALSSTITLDLSRVTACEAMFLGAQSFNPQTMLSTHKTRHTRFEDPEHFGEPIHFNSLDTAAYFLKLKRQDKTTQKYCPESVAELRILLRTGVTLPQISPSKLTSLRGAFATGSQYSNISNAVRNPHLHLILDLEIDNWEALQTWDVNHIRDFSYCFAGQHNLDHVPFTKLLNAQNCEGMFADCWSLTKIDFSNLTSNNINATHIAKNTGVVFTKDYKFKHTPQQELYDKITEVELAQQIAMRALKDGDKYVPTSLQEFRILIHNNPQIDFAQIDTSRLTTMAGAFACVDFKDYSNLNVANHILNIHIPTIEKLQCTSWNNIGSLQVSHIEDFSCCFEGQTTFNTNISNWNTTRARTMSSMFYECTEFNQPVNFNTAQVTDMAFTFYGCKKFNQLVNFDTSKVTNIESMFDKCEEFNHPVNFNTTQVTKMNYMFYGCKKFNQPVNFDTSLVTTTKTMFYQCEEFNNPVNFNTTQVTNMNEMFVGCKKFNQPVNFDTSKVTTMQSMFSDCEEFNHPINFNTAQVTDMSKMFVGCKKFNQPVNFDTFKVTDMRSMFNGCEEFNHHVNFNTAQVTYMSEMFVGCKKFNQDVSLDISKVKVEELENMFFDCPQFMQTLHLTSTNLDTLKNVANKSIFNDINNLQSRVVLNYKSNRTPSIWERLIDYLFIPDAQASYQVITGEELRSLGIVHY